MKKMTERGMSPPTMEKNGRVWDFVWITRNIFKSAESGTEMLKAASKDRRDKDETCNCDIDVIPTRKNRLKCNDDSCSLRRIGVECGKGCGRQCANRPISGNQFCQPKFTIAEVDGKGWCLFTTETIKKGSFIGEYLGMVQRKREMVQGQVNEYVVGVKGTDLIVDARWYGSYFRFAANSHKPNMELRQYVHKKEIKLLFVASENISAGSELVWLYGNGFKFQECRCGEDECPDIGSFRAVRGSKTSTFSSASFPTDSPPESTEIDNFDEEQAGPSQNCRTPNVSLFNSDTAEGSSGPEPPSTPSPRPKKLRSRKNACQKQKRNPTAAHTEGKSACDEVPPSPLLEIKKRAKLGKRDNGVKRNSLEKNLFRCEHCFKSFKRYNDLQRHTASHVNRREFVCGEENCAKAFNTNRLLKRHMLTHTNTQRFKCPICKKRFQRHDSMIRHVQNIHKRRKANTSGRPKTHMSKKESILQEKNSESEFESDSDSDIRD